MRHIDELIGEGIENLPREELLYLTRVLIEKRSRGHIGNEVFHESLSNLNLQERCQLIVDGLCDVIAKKIGEKYIFDFDAAGLYLPKENNDLELVASSGKSNDSLRKIIPSDDFIASFKEHLQFGKSGEKYEEVILPLVAGKTYQGTILLSNKASGKKISFSKFRDFFYTYSDAAAEAVFGGIEHKKLLEESDRLYKLNKAFQDMAAKTAHEIRGSITPMYSGGFLAQEILNKPEITPFELGLVKKFVNMMIKTAKETEEEVENLPDFARLQSGYKPTFMIYQWNRSIREDIETFTIIANEKNMKIVTKLAHSTDEIYTDPDLSNRAQRNVFGNSVRHGEAGTKTEPSIIEVSTERKNNGVYLSIMNEGFIPDTKKIFEDFYTTLQRGGTGLGLSIVKGNVGLLGGTVKAENIIEDKPKVRFTIYLPQ